MVVLIMNTRIIMHLNNKKSLISSLICGLLFSSFAQSVTTPVTTSSNLQAIINNATEGDTLQFASGTYSTTSTLNITKSLTFTSSANASTLIAIDGANSHRVIHFSGLNKTLSLHNIQIQNGFTSDGNGGAGLLITSGTVTISNTSFINNKASSGDGGAIANKGNLTVKRSTFNNNAVQSASAFGNAISNNTGATTIATYNTFVGNNNPNNQTTSGTIHNAGTLTLGANILDNTLNCSQTSSATNITLGFNGQSANSCTYLNALTDLKNLGSLSLATLSTVNTIQVFIPNAGSPIIDQASTSATTGLTCSGTDASNKTVPINNKCDIGAVEYKPVATTTTTSNTSTNNESNEGNEGNEGDDAFLGTFDTYSLLIWLLISTSLTNRRKNND